MSGTISPESARGILLVTEVPPTVRPLPSWGRSTPEKTAAEPVVRNPNGFSARLYHLSTALAARRPVDLMGILTDAADLDGQFFQADLAVRHYSPVLVKIPAINCAGLRGKVSRGWQFLFGALPASSQPRKLRALDLAVRSSSPALVVLYLPHLAHLAHRVPSSTPVVCVLEEGWERVEALNMTNRADASRLRKSWIIQTEGRRAARLYRRVSRRAAAVVAISEEERTWFSRTMPPDIVTVIPHSVDCEYFQPLPLITEDLDVAVFGNLFQPRNADAAIAVWREAVCGSSDWRWGFVGKPSPGLAAEVSLSGSVVTGFVEDIRPHYARAKVVLVPATSGIGVKTTVLEAWAMGRPVVATPFALTGLPAMPEQNVLVGESRQDLIAQTRRLLASPQLRDRLGAAGRSTVLASRDARVTGQQFAELCEKVIADECTRRAGPSRAYVGQR